jgi:hypothetical protein
MTIFSIESRGSLSSLLGAIAVMACIGIPTSVAAQEFMSEEELLATIPGSTIHAKTNKGVPWAQAYGAYKGGKKKGAINGILEGKKYKATWFVKDGQWCENWGDGEACWQVERVDAKSLRMYADGKARPNLWILK